MTNCINKKVNTNFYSQRKFPLDNRQPSKALTFNHQNRQNLTVNHQSYTPIETLCIGQVILFATRGCGIKSTPYHPVPDLIPKIFSLPPPPPHPPNAGPRYLPVEISFLTCSNTSLRTVPPNTRPFCAEYNYAGKADLSTGR